MTGQDPRVTLRSEWAVMSISDRFEQIVAMILSFLIAVVVVVTMVQLVREVIELLVAGTLDPLDPEGFQLVFGAILTVLIAMEFRHSIVPLAIRTDHIVQVRTVLLVAILAIARKFIVLEAGEPAFVASLAGTALALGIVYRLLSGRDGASD